MRLSIFALFTITMATSAQSQTVTNADSVQLQPTISRDAGGIVSCGVRAVAIIGGGSGTDFRGFDFSVTIHAEAMSGMLKAGIRRVPELLATASSVPKRALARCGQPR